MFQNLAWQPDPGAADTVSPPVDRWLVLGRAPLAEAVTRAGLDAACLEHDPQLHRTLEALSRAPRAGVLFAEGLDEELDPLAHIDRALRWATLVRAAQDAGAPLWLITRRAVLLPGDTRAVSPSAALLLALGRAAFAEHATLLGGVLDVPDDVDWLPRALGAPSRQSAAWRQGVRHTERRVTATLAATDARPAANVLIIGGLGGLGAALAARWAAAGSRLVLVGRGGPPPLPHHEYHPVDVRDRAAMQRVFAGRRFDRVVHAAGELHVGSLVRTARDAFERVFAPKVEGTLALAALLEGTSTQVLLLTSTAGALEGQQGGVGAYAAANAFQDAFAHRRRQLGLPWSSICLPSIRGVGLSARLEGAASAHAAAVPSLSLDEALVAIDATLANPSAQVIVAADTPSPTSAPPEARPLAPRAVLRAELEPTLRALLARETNQPADAIDPHRTFQSFGIDSLGALDLIRSLEEQVGMRLSDTLMFEHDTLDKLLTALSTGQGAPRAKASAPAAAAPSAAVELPVLPAQKTFYANQRFFPHLPAYVFLRADLKGPVDAELIAAGVEVLFRRHPMLRVTFTLRDGVLLQREGAFAAPALVQREAAAGELDAVEADFRNQTFSLEHGPLFQFALIRTAPAQATLMLHVHHIVADAWSGQLLLLELLELHRRGSEGLALELPELATSFSDCVRAFEARSDDARDSRAWWRQTLEKPPPRLKLPFDSDPDAVPQGPCHLHQVELDAATTGALLERAKQSSCSMFELVFAAYASCLREWSGQSELLVRVAQARRDARLPDVDRVVGCFADSLPLRLSVDADLAQLLRRVREASLAAQQHGLTSSLELAGLGAERSPGGPRGLTPAGFSFPDFKAPERFGAVEIAAVRAGAATGFTQLGLIAWQFRGKLHLSWNFTGALFRPETVRRLSAELQARLRSLAAQRRAPLPRGAVVPARIAASLEAAGDRVVLVTPAERVTARALRQRAEALSRALAEEGAAPNRLVVVLARPGVEATVAVLGVLGAGAAYVPIDPDYPDARVAQLALHSGAELLVTTRDQLVRLRELPELNARLRRVLLVDGVAKDAGPHVRTWPQILEATGRPRLAAPADLAYVMYTSGTTAEPKGVCVTHAAVSLFHDWVHDAFEVTSSDAFIQTSSLSFGGSIRQIYSPLLAGACLYPAPSGLTKDPLALAAFLDDHGITVWNSVPSLWRRLLDSIQAQAPERRPKLERLRWVLIGGEQVPATLVHEWRGLYGHRHRIANLYGSTETVVNATAFEVPQGFDGRGQVPIGRARAGSQVRLLDDALQPVATGETGELYVGGPSLSSGYHRAPELTRAAFVEVPGERGPFYRTGDLARRSPEGELQFLGRADTQVKVRGNRVELAEVEAALESLSQVKAAVVVERREGEQQWLVAHVQLRDEGAALDPAALRAGVAARLPAFMVPHRFEKATVFPLTSAGKVDRRALAARPSAQPVAEEPTSAGSWSNTEQVVARVWSETLRLASVDRSDDFFGLGGDSLIALDMLARLEKQLGAMPPPVTLYSARTVEQLAKAIDAQSRAAPPAAHAAAPTDEPFSLAPSQVGFLLAERAGAGAAPVWCADLPGRGALDRARFTAALQSVVERHPMLRVVFERHGLKTLQRVCPTVTLPLEWHDVSALPHAAQAQRIDEHFARRCAQPFDLAAGPGWSLALFVTGKGTFRCLIAVHHAVGDGWSVQLFGAELLAAYDGARGRAPLRAGFRDVVEHQLELARSDFSAGLAFWQQQLEGLPPPAPLASHDTGSVSLELPPAATAALRAGPGRAHHPA
ncbi:MAG: amino acid adenylation domain-containing protein [Archangiaceae bacterium]|nr:amino acid adenylation domain-containing protein [Archangiaceae bacterium]